MSAVVSVGATYRMAVPKDGEVDTVGALGALPELEPVLVKCFVGQQRREEGCLVRQEQAALTAISITLGVFKAP